MLTRRLGFLLLQPIPDRDAAEPQPLSVERAKGGHQFLSANGIDRPGGRRREPDQNRVRLRAQVMEVGLPNPYIVVQNYSAGSVFEDRRVRTCAIQTTAR
jgi:hypothetical protein